MSTILDLVQECPFLSLTNDLPENGFMLFDKGKYMSGTLHPDSHSPVRGLIYLATQEMAEYVLLASPPEMCIGLYVVARTLDEAREAVKTRPDESITSLIYIPDLKSESIGLYVR